MARCIIDRCHTPLKISKNLAISVLAPWQITDDSGSSRGLPRPISGGDLRPSAATSLRTLAAVPGSGVGGYGLCLAGELVRIQGRVFRAAPHNARACHSG